MKRNARCLPILLGRLFICVLSGVLMLGGLAVLSHATTVTEPPAQTDDETAAPEETVDPTQVLLENLLYKPDPGAPVMSQSTLQAEIDRAVREKLPTVTLTGNVWLTESLKVRGLKAPLTIDGNGYSLLLVRTAQEQGRHILVTQPDGFNLLLTLYNLRLEGPGGGITGGGVSMASGVDILLDTCVITGCLAKEGGAVYNYNNDIYLNNAIVAANSAETGGGLYSYYGNIYIEGAHAEISTNTATSTETGGGGVYSHYGVIATGGGARFIGNSATRYGGAFYLCEGGLVKADEAVFSGNTAADGGAIAIGQEAGAIQLSGSQFLYNKALGRADGTGGFGGGVYRQGGGALTVENCRFIVNEAIFGGAILTGSGTEDSLSVSGSTFRGNTAVYDGGAVYSSDRISPTRPRPAVITSTRLDNNEAGRNGGAVYSTNHAALRLSGVGFTGNAARSCLEWDIQSPGALYSEEASIYQNNIGSVEASRHPESGASRQFANVYNNWDINFPVNVTVTYRPWGGRWADTENMENRRQVLFIGEEAQPPAELTREGYLFGGWRVATAGHPDEGDVWNFGDTTLRTMVLDAVWLEEVEATKLILKPMGGVWGDGTNRNRLIYAEKQSFGYQPDTLSRPGFRFVGWFNQSSNLKWSFATDKLFAESMVLVARWSALPPDDPAAVPYDPNRDDSLILKGLAPAMPDQLPGFDLIFGDGYPISNESSAAPATPAADNSLTASAPQTDRPTAPA